MTTTISREDGTGWTLDGKPDDRPEHSPRCDEWVEVTADAGTLVEAAYRSRCIGVENHRGDHLSEVRFEWGRLDLTGPTRASEVRHGRA